MYGTTETQRAVSYYAIAAASRIASSADGGLLSPSVIPSNNPHSPAHELDLKLLKEVIAAGRGMKDVQLVVVDRQDRKVRCTVGEVGEIYVRSGGWAEAYLDPSATQEKFIVNRFGKEGKEKSPVYRDVITEEGGPEKEFWLGIRARMYKSGDSGRANDQVKIRGFRIELGEIDTWLGHHWGVRENLTLVPGDKDEEKILISYFVPKDDLDATQKEFGATEAGWISKAVKSGAGDDEEKEAGGKAKEREAARGMKSYRRFDQGYQGAPEEETSCIQRAYTVRPTQAHATQSYGKIDKPVLPFLDTAQLSSILSSLEAKAPAAETSKQALSPATATMQKLWHSLLPHLFASPADIPLDESFFDLGGHSILATQPVIEIRKVFVIDVPLGMVFDVDAYNGEGTNVRGMVKRVEDLDVETSESSNRTSSLKTLPRKQREKAVNAVKYGEDYDALVKMVATSCPSPAHGTAGDEVIMLPLNNPRLAHALPKLLDDASRISPFEAAKTSSASESRIAGQLGGCSCQCPQLEIWRVVGA